MACIIGSSDLSPLKKNSHLVVLKVIICMNFPPSVLHFQFYFHQCWKVRDLVSYMKSCQEQLELLLPPSSLFFWDTDSYWQMHACMLPVWFEIFVYIHPLRQFRALFQVFHGVVFSFTCACGKFCHFISGFQCTLSWLKWRLFWRCCKRQRSVDRHVNKYFPKVLHPYK